MEKSDELYKKENMQENEHLSNEYIVKLLDNLEENFFSVDIIKNQVTFGTKACMKIYGYPVERFFEDPDFWFKVIHPDDKQWVMEQRALLDKGDTIRREYRVVHPDGTIKWVSNKVIPTLTKDGKLTRVDGYTMDINERKKAELKLEKYNILMYQISHDLRGPLNAAKNYISLALNKVTDPTAQNYLQKIGNSYNKLESHVLSLLDLGRLNRTEVHTEKIELIPFVRNIIGTMDGIAGFDKVKFSVDINVPDDFYSDRQYLQSIFYNLINNAIKFRRNITDSIVNITVHTENHKTVIRVSDNGKGIPEATKQSVFKMFVKCVTHTEGSGLGLYIVKHMVKKLKGEIDLESEEMKGTTFTVTLPIMQ